MHRLQQKTKGASSLRFFVILLRTLARSTRYMVPSR